MDALTAITSVGSMVSAVRSLFQGLKAPQKAAEAKSDTKFDDSLAKAIAALMKDRDKNKDGVLSASEFGSNTALFNQLDANKDGKLDVMELAKAFSGTSANSVFKSAK